MSVKRYELVACDEHACHCDVVESAEGDMVDYEDYAALEIRCAALAAENAGLKESRKNLAEFIHEELDAGYPLNMSIETPATDDFLAEVRAQGVEMFSASLKVVGGHEHPYSAVANEFAAQLRKGVQS
ncbi:hypothetical protein ACWQF4_000102 [Enterobacter kobei]